MDRHKTKILVLMPNLNVGGAEVVTAKLLSMFDPAAFDIRLVVICASQNELINVLPKWIRITFLNHSKIKNALVRLILITHFEKPDIIFANASHLNLLLSIFRPFLPKKSKLIVRETNVVSLNNRNYSFPLIWNFLYKTFYANIDNVICQSRVMQLDLINKFNILEPKTRLIYNPLDVDYIRTLSQKKVDRFIADFFSPPDRSFGEEQIKSLVIVAGLRREKNHCGLIEAISQLKNKKVKLAVVGDGLERKNLEALVEELAMADRIKFFGFQKNPYPFIALADALVLTSLNEGMPNILLEALALNKFILTTPIGGVAEELLTGRGAHMVSKSSSVVDIGLMLDRWLTLPHQACPISDISSFEAAKIVKQYQDVFTVY